MKLWLEEDLKNSKIAKKYLGNSLDEVNHLSNLIEDVLNLSHIEYKRNIMFLREYNLVEVINECIGSLDLLAKRNEIEINFSYNTNPINYKTDIELFEKLVKNLIENAIFHAGKKAILKIRLSEDNGKILLEFSDNGIGIDKQDLPYIFQRFYRGKNHFHQKTIGSGLGLSIVKHIVALHNGKISVTSIPNIETKFSITFPEKVITKNIKLKYAKIIYIVEDDENIQEIISYNLEKNGYETRGFSTGKDFWIILKRKPDLVILDLMLPDMDGYDICNMLRTKYVPVLILSAKGEELDKVLGLELGADDYMVKPFGIREFLARVKNILKRSEQIHKEIA